MYGLTCSLDLKMPPARSCLHEDITKKVIVVDVNKYFHSTGMREVGV